MNMIQQISIVMQNKRADLISQPLSRIYNDMAKAVLEHIRDNPSPAMIEAAENYSMYHYDKNNSKDMIEAMLDAALKEE